MIMYKIETFTKELFNPILPDNDLINLVDITQSLGNQCRFAGHIPIFYSVAEHSLRVADLLPEELKLTGLLHDAGEAYMLDLPRPLKIQLPKYSEFEDNLLKLIMYKFGGIYPLPKEVKEADDMVLKWEFDNIKHNSNHLPLLPDEAISRLYNEIIKRVRYE